MKLHLGDCLDIMKSLPDGGVDMVLADLPYGTTACRWDSVIELDKLWPEYYRVTKKNAALVFTASQPFTTQLGHSNLQDLKYGLIWEKGQGVNFLQAKTQPMKIHEDILMFYRETPTYNPIMTYSTPYTTGTGGFNAEFRIKLKSGPGGLFSKTERRLNETGSRYPVSIIRVPRETQHLLHPTQKPVGLMEYLVRTYTNPGETVLDNTMGSGTTGVACIQAGREFIGIEKDPEYFRRASQRLSNVTPALACFQ